ncbi:hypothetical protein [Desertivirga arenae]|uniref:hypothetical protein n=1 Tax=Desertivirga arenae TaxID=2810309 RepID=UPI001A977136|nr:hypothetical protein [Pedobacter sp. SYSU D00823]
MTLQFISNKERLYNKIVNVAIINFAIFGVLTGILDLIKIGIIEALSVFTLLVAILTLPVGAIAAFSKLFLNNRIRIEPEAISQLSLNIGEQDFVDRNYDKVKNSGNWISIGGTKFELGARDASFVAEVLRDQSTLILRNESKVFLLDEPSYSLFKEVAQSMWGL